MRRIALPFVVLLFGAVSHMAAQTNHIIGGPYQDGYYPPYLYSFGIELDGTGNSIGWITGALNHEWACGNGKPSSGGVHQRNSKQRASTLRKLHQLHSLRNDDHQWLHRTRSSY